MGLRQIGCLGSIKQNQFMATIHFVGGEKGGVGKSLVSRVLAQYMIDQSIPFLGFDTDRSHGALLRFYTDFASPVVVDSYESLDAIVEAALEVPERRILVDLAAQTHDPLVRWMDESGVLELAEEQNLSVRYWHVMDSGKDSVDLLGKLLNRFGSRLKYVIVLNELRGSTFEIFDKSPEKVKALELNARFVSVKKLHETSINKIDGSSSSFWSAVNNKEKSVTGLGLLERQRVKVWLKNLYAELTSAEV